MDTITFRIDQVLDSKWEQFCADRGVGLYAKNEGFGHTMESTSIATAVYYCGEKVLGDKTPDDEWLIDGCLIYRLKNGSNSDEIRVTMCDDSRDDLICAALAELIQELLIENEG